MNRHNFLIGAFIIIIVVIFILPSFMGDSISDLEAVYANAGNSNDNGENVKQVTRLKYLFGLNIFLDYASKIVGVLSLIGILYQFKREQNMKESEFVLQINTEFIKNQDIKRIYAMLEDSKNEGQQTNPFTIKDEMDMANYLCFFETFYPLVNRGVLCIRTIDILAYRFFLAVNNRFMQEMLICKPGKETAWKDLYSLHYKWKKYRKNQVWQEEFDLSHNEKYREILKLSA